MGKHGPSIVVVFRGKKYRRYPEGTNVSMARYFTASDGEFLHRAKWKHLRGPIPPGAHIHHKNGDHTDNRIANLEPIDGREHLAAHSRSPGRAAVAKDRLLRFAVPASRAWHSSPDGKAFHSANGRAAMAARPVLTIACAVCGAAFQTIQPWAVVCSGKCNAKKRRDSGLDDREFKCERCGDAFMRSRFAKRPRFCSHACCRADRKDRAGL